MKTYFFYNNLFSQAPNLEPDPDLALNSPMPLTDGTPYPVTDGFNITEEFLDFYYSFFITKTFPQSSYNRLNCSEYFSSKEKEYTRLKVLKDEITKDMLHMYEIYKIEKRFEDYYSMFVLRMQYRNLGT